MSVPLGMRGDLSRVVSALPDMSVKGTMLSSGIVPLTADEAAAIQHICKFVSKLWMASVDDDDRGEPNITVGVGED